MSLSVADSYPTAANQLLRPGFPDTGGRTVSSRLRISIEPIEVEKGRKLDEVERAIVKPENKIAETAGASHARPHSWCTGGTRGSDDEAGDKSAAQTHEEPAAAVAAEASAFRDLSTRERRPRVPGRTGFRTSHPRLWRLFPRPPSASATRLHVARQPRALLLRRRRAGGGESGEGGTCAHAQRPVGWPRQPMSGGVPPVPREIPPGHDRGTGGRRAETH
ncbi:hypothetical protein HPB51_013769 [Rhipicephalus microplus]|uniref:Uncharacterized protein n=1 Tax=Rhipicephalus microplus TaxID=6941 RepID=A0A9J6F4G2_RHIMP|nr:hypothetical protein HPB51_013769 [Rhipicephalus microplus]